jgi:hypothetical protein
MLQQDSVQRISGRPPALYGTNERDSEESYGEHCQHLCVYMYVPGSWWRTQLEHKQKKKGYEELEAAWALVAACNAWYHAGFNCENEETMLDGGTLKGKMRARSHGALTWAKNATKIDATRKTWLMRLPVVCGAVSAWDSREKWSVWLRAQFYFCSRAHVLRMKKTGSIELGFHARILWSKETYIRRKRVKSRWNLWESRDSEVLSKDVCTCTVTYMRR